MQVFFTPEAFFRTFARFDGLPVGDRLVKKTTIRNRKNVLYFRRWARRGYAAFVSLGRQVKISRLRTDMCQGEERKARRSCSPQEPVGQDGAQDVLRMNGEPPLGERQYLCALFFESTAAGEITGRKANDSYEIAESARPSFFPCGKDGRVDFVF